MKLRIQDMDTNILLSSGSIGVQEGTVVDKMTIGDMLTDIGRTASGYIATKTDGTHARYATVGDSLTNISLDSVGAMRITATAGEDGKVIIQNIVSDLGRKNGKVKVATGNSLFNFMGPTNSNGFTSIAAAPDILYSTLLSDASVTSPEVGSAGTVTGTILYDTLGGDVDANGKYFDFPWTPATVGTWEVEWTPHIDSTSATNNFILDTDDASTRVLILYQTTTEIAAGRAGALAGTSSLLFAADQTIKLRLVWDAAGIDGGTNIHRFYVDGVLNGTNDTALPAVSQTVLRLGNNAGDTLHANGKMRNLKIWSTAIIP